MMSDTRQDRPAANTAGTRLDLARAWGMKVKVAVCEHCDWSYLLPQGTRPRECPHCFQAELTPLEGQGDDLPHSRPPELRDWLQAELGTFPLLHFWGPGADITSSRWIADASVRVMREYNPTLTLVYLPHLDYNLQRLGPGDPRIAADLREVDVEAGKLIDAARSRGAEVVVLSEYAITDVSRPVHMNRILREHGYLEVRREPLGWETLDAGASRAFAVSDHQVAHIYVRYADDVTRVADLLRSGG